jgi:uncharacterized Zn finger protein (UPF0148 family)
VADNFVAFQIEDGEMVCPNCGARFPNTFDGLMTGARPHTDKCTTEGNGHE